MIDPRIIELHLRRLAKAVRDLLDCAAEAKRREACAIYCPDGHRNELRRRLEETEKHLGSD